MTAAQSIAPPGGWAVDYLPPDKPGFRLHASGYSPENVASKIFAWRANNGLPRDEDAVWDFLNNIWCSRAPDRCPGYEAAPLQVAAGGRRILRPLDYGSWIWQYLNTFGVEFDKGRFLSAIDQAKALLAPHAPHGAGCSVCYGHFGDALALYNPYRVRDAVDASVWVWTVHNLASVHAGNPRQSFNRIAVKYGWEPLDEMTILSIQQVLKV